MVTPTGNGHSYLLGLDKVYKPSGVYIDDPKGLFILRWYKEVDEYNSKALEGYQNRECAAYQLRLDNDGALFRWTANVQIISKVYLRRKDQPRTFTLNKKDERMVENAVAKKR